MRSLSEIAQCHQHFVVTIIPNHRRTKQSADQGRNFGSGCTWVKGVAPGVAVSQVPFRIGKGSLYAPQINLGLDT